MHDLGASAMIHRAPLITGSLTAGVAFTAAFLFAKTTGDENGHVHRSGLSGAVRPNPQTRQNRQSLCRPRLARVFCRPLLLCSLALAVTMRTRPSLWFLTVAAAAALFLRLAPAAEPAAQRPNVIFLFADARALCLFPPRNRQTSLN